MTKKALQQKTKSKANGKGAKVVLREKLTKSGLVTSKQIDKIAESRGWQPATIRTALSDLQNAKYAGPLGVLAIEKDKDGTYRLAK